MGSTRDASDGSAFETIMGVVSSGGVLFGSFLCFWFLFRKYKQRK